MGQSGGYDGTMPRPPRIDFADAVYHVTSRGNGRAQIFLSDEDNCRFLQQLQDNVGTFGVVLYAYVLVGNHFHLLVRTPRANLSQFMQRLNTSYALYARYKHRRPGHQFEARFKAKLVQDNTYLLGVTRYIHLNPIQTKASQRLPAPERLERLEQYRWSSYPGYVAKKNAKDFVCYDVLRDYGSTMAEARRHYRAYTRAGVLEGDQPILDAMRVSRYAVGDDEFVKKTEDRLQERRTGEARDKDVALPSMGVDADVIDMHVAAYFGIDTVDLAEHGHRVGLAKFVAVELTCRLAEWNQRAVGQRYGGISSAAVSTIRRKIREGHYEVAPVIESLLREITTASQGMKVNN
jgi:REP element-mobilizing transposase RayT